MQPRPARQPLQWAVHLLLPLRLLLLLPLQQQPRRYLQSPLASQLARRRRSSSSSPWCRLAAAQWGVQWAGVWAAWPQSLLGSPLLPVPPCHLPLPCSLQSLLACRQSLQLPPQPPLLPLPPTCLWDRQSRRQSLLGRRPLRSHSSRQRGGLSSPPPTPQRQQTPPPPPQQQPPPQAALWRSLLRLGAGAGLLLGHARRQEGVEAFFLACRARPPPLGEPRLCSRGRGQRAMQ